jgi:hypothetical protein
MAIVKDEGITREDVINKFNLRVRDWVASNVTLLGNRTYTASHSVWNGTPGWKNGGDTSGPAYRVTRTLNSTAAALALNSTNAGGATDSILNTDRILSEVMLTSDFTPDVGAANSTGHVIKILRDMMASYSRVHQIRIQNIGNLTFSISGVAGTMLSDTGVAIGTTTRPTAIALMNTDMDLYINTNNLKAGGTLDADKFNNFLETCRSIWLNRCVNSGVLETFNFSYCHSSCHSNVTCYNSRGRR